MFDKKTENHTHHSFPVDALGKIEALMVDKAVSAARRAVLGDREPLRTAGYAAGEAIPTEAVRRLGSIAGSVNREPARLEPFYNEVKEAAKYHKITEKEADKMIRKSLLSVAIHNIRDEQQRAIFLAIVAAL